MPQNVHLAQEKLALAFLDELKSVMSSYLFRDNMLEMSSTTKRLRLSLAKMLSPNLLFTGVADILSTTPC